MRVEIDADGRDAIPAGEPSGDQADLAALIDAGHPRKKTAAAWARVHVPDVSGDEQIDRQFWSAAVDAGLTRLMMPASVGGSEDSAVATMLTFEGLGLGTRSLGPVFALVSQVIATQRALARFATPAQQDRWLRPLVHGRALGAFAMTEPRAGSATASITTVAEADGDGFRLTGTKAWATLGPECDVLVVFAATDPDAGRWGQTAFVVDTSAAGVTLQAATPKFGLHGCPVGEIGLDEVAVDVGNILGRIGAGASVFSYAVDAERAFMYGSQLGATERLLADAIDWTRAHRVGDAPLGGHQAVSHRVVDMHLRHQSARMLLFRAALLHDRGAPVAEAAALAKLAISEGAVESALDMIRILGARGYGTDHSAGTDLLDALGGWFYSGTSDIARNVVASSLRLERPRRR